MNDRVKCLSLMAFLCDNKPYFFDVSGGCGYDKSHGKDNCMTASGIWFKYCPFCGRQIKSKFNGNNWEWWEE